MDTVLWYAGCKLCEQCWKWSTGRPADSHFLEQKKKKKARYVKYHGHQFPQDAKIFVKKLIINENKIFTIQVTAIRNLVCALICLHKNNVRLFFSDTPDSLADVYRHKIEFSPCNNHQLSK